MASAHQIALTSRSFLWCGLATMASGILFGARRVIAIERWSLATGEVTKSALVENTDSEGGRICGAKVTVLWRAGNQEISHVFDQWGASTNKAHYQSIVAFYKVGSKTPVRYNPSNPASAYLEAGYSLRFFSAPLLIALGGALFAALGYFVGLLRPSG